MVILGKWKQFTLSISLKTNSLTISLQGPAAPKSGPAAPKSGPAAPKLGPAAGSQVFSYDATGRLWTAMLENISYRRGLNGRSIAKWQTTAGSMQEMGRDRRWLAPHEASALEERARQTAADLLADLRAGHVGLASPLPPGTLAAFERAAGFTTERYQADVLAYQQVYKPVGILPPDQYMAVVLQATEGCSFNTCTFCNFYRDRPFRIKTPEAFRQHALAVRDFLGDGLSLRRTIFLGDANALVVPMPRLLELLDVVHEVYDVERLGGIYAFLDGFSGERKTVEDYRKLAQRGVRRIYIGMESGSEALLRLLKKPGKPADVVQAVRAIKAAGIAVGIIVLLGAGGKAYAREHVHDTIRAINAMPLDLDDLIYFSELIESEGLEYTRDAYSQQFGPLASDERIAQGDEIERGLKFRANAGVPHISRYDIREFVY